ncbi:MAG: alpha-N-arabinofuranosidase [Culturomica sp.]|jgi:alpha-N-arabinofuranosidase|nr:alpha-N-arabinofuranosidase [Culturomica sp.]
MNKKIIVCSLLLAFSAPLLAQETSTVNLNVNEAKTVIPKEIYGQFAEHLGTCIYGGLWVGENSSIPNINGYRSDVFNALKELKVPVLRWPGGCFADEYHWMDGIGPKEKRPKMVNNNWGGTVEDNSFGTNEFLNLCEMLNCEPYISGNVGSGTVEEMAKWVEYMTSASDSPMARLRRENGRDKPWKVKFFGVGNESWGCGGNMTPEFYSDMYRRYSTYCRNYDGNWLFKIASGATDYDYDWTRVLMKNVGPRMNGLSLHYYTVLGWEGSKGSATQFDKDDYYWTMGKCREIEDVIKRHCAIMDSYDPQKRVALLLDEWGTWWDEEPGTVRGHLFQQNTMRDAFVASLSFDIFHKYTDRLKMANIAQVVNVLQSMILTNNEGAMVLTPTYYVFKMYNVHQDATYIPLNITCKEVPVRDNRTVPMLSATASKDKDGKVHISLSNVDADNEQTVTINLTGVKATKAVGEILTAKDMTDYNTFEHPDAVKPVPFKDAKVNKDVLTLKLPAKSIVTLELQ